MFLEEVSSNAQKDGKISKCVDTHLEPKVAPMKNNKAERSSNGNAKV